MDKEDLEEKYKNKPGRAATIMKSCDQYYCEQAECKFFTDLDYTTIDMTGTKRDVTRTTEMEQESKNKLKKKANVAKGNAADNTDKVVKVVVEKSLTEKHLTSATAIKESLEGMAEQWLKTQEAINGSKQEEFMASMKIPDKWHDIAEAIDKFVSELDVSIEEKKGDFKEISNNSKELKTRSKEFIKNVDEMLEPSKKFNRGASSPALCIGEEVQGSCQLSLREFSIGCFR